MIAYRAPTAEELQALRDYGRDLARLSPEEIERRKWAPWVEKLRRLEDPLTYEFEQDRREGETYW